MGALNADDDELFTQALQSFLVIPQFALVKNPKESASEVRRKLFEFREGPKESKEDKGRKRKRPSQQPPPGMDIEELPPHVKKAIDQVKYQAAEGRLKKASQWVTQAAEGRAE